MLALTALLALIRPLAGEGDATAFGLPADVFWLTILTPLVLLAALYGFIRWQEAVDRRSWPGSGA
jgi:hypothetical protein